MIIVKPTFEHFEHMATIFNLSILPFLRIYSEEEKTAFTVKETPQTIVKQLKNKEAVVVLIDDVIVGYAIFYKKNDYCIWLNSMYVLPDYQKIGVGTNLLLYIEAWAVATKATVIALETHEEANWAHKFYKKNGYRRVDKELHEFPDYKILDKAPVANRPIFVKYF